MSKPCRGDYSFVLRITTETAADEIRFTLAGKLAGPWVDEFERTWQAQPSLPRRLIIDLSEVTFIDAEGKKLLAWMHKQGADFIAAGCMTRCVVEQITRRPHHHAH